MTLDDYRQFYAEEIRVAANVHSEELTRAFAAVHREHYLGPPPWKICSGEQAALICVGLSTDLYTTTEKPRDLYHNVLVAIDAARYLNNGHPSTLARWISELDLTPGQRVYHAGCGVGYYTAILAEMVGPQGQVIAIDVDPDLASRARQNLSAYSQVIVQSGDGAALDPGLCDAMLINAGVIHPHPLWLERLKAGGRLVFPLTAKVTEYHGNGVMVKVTREACGLAARVISFVAIFSFSTLRSAEIEAQLSAALAKRTLLKLKSLRLDSHEQVETCLVHTASICFSSSGVVAAS